MPEAASGTGEVLTFTINRQQWLPGLVPPYVIAVVGLDDDPDLRVTSRLVHVEPAEVAIGMRVRACFEAAGDVWVPVFVPERTAP